MSAKFSIIPAAAILDSRITPQQLRTLAYISLRGGNKEDGIFHSYETLAAALGIKRRQIIEQIKNLCTCGYVIKEADKRPDGSASTNTYRVQIDVSTTVHRGSAAPLHHPPINDAATALGSAAPLHPLDSKHTNLNIDKKNNVKKSTKITLAQWEENKGTQLCVEMMMNWCRENDLDPAQVKKAIPAFRERMQSGENLYANFVATFQVWLRNGYLPIKIEQAKRKTTTHGDGTVIIDRGLTL